MLVSDQFEHMWSKCLAEIGIESASLLSQSPYDLARRTYLSNEYVYKIVLLEHENTQQLRVQDLSGEFEILKHCKNISGIPLAIKYYHTEHFAVLVLRYIQGEALVNLQVGWLRLFIILAKLSTIVLRLARRGVSHNDILEENIRISPSGRVYLIDFDQASYNSFGVSLIRSFIGIKIGNNKVYSSLLDLVKKHFNKQRLSLEEHIKKRLPPRVKELIKRILRYNSPKPSPKVSNNLLPEISENASALLKNLLTAWKIAQYSNASSPGVEVAYYALDIDGYHFPGERPWVDRWNMLRTITDYSGKRILELGCNMALLSCFLIKEEKALLGLFGQDYAQEITGYTKGVKKSIGCRTKSAFCLF